jgi:hypothetical protein
MNPSQDDNPSAATTAVDPAEGACPPRGEAIEPGRDAAERLPPYGRLAADTLGSFAERIEAMATGMRDGEAAHLSDPVAGMAGGLRRLSDTLRSERAGQVLRDAERMARENPMLAIAGGIALGVGLAQFTLASVADLVAQRPRATSDEPDGQAGAGTTDVDADSSAEPMTSAGESPRPD